MLVQLIALVHVVHSYSIQLQPTQAGACVLSVWHTGVPCASDTAVSVLRPPSPGGKLEHRSSSPRARSNSTESILQLHSHHSSTGEQLSLKLGHKLRMNVLPLPFDPAQSRVLPVAA